ncbi:MAG: phytanoyl-CoA dioxygenase family protein [Candidatus Poribacteria bacterium]|nr:phytanoyl-CoA dioxygenase family protein [Candidatus Poribacteria bacterium]
MASKNMGLTPEQKTFYETNGYVVLEDMFAQKECQRFVQHMEDLHTGQKQLQGFFQQDKYGDRTFNQHLYDPYVLEFLIDARLHKPLSDCFGGEPEAIQTMHFYEGSEHPLHQDQYYLPDCMSAWIAMVDVDINNGPLIVQPGSHRGRLITKSDVPMTLHPDETYEQQQTNRYFPEVERVFIQSGNKEVQVLVNQGDAVLFHGRLIHGGAPVLKPGTRRHALACHYIPYHSENWERDWPRISFDGSRRVHFRKI